MYLAHFEVNYLFLGKDEVEEKEDSDSDKEEPKKTAKELTLSHRVGKKTKKRKKKLDRALDAVKKHKKKKTSVEAFNFSALHLIYDPQGFRWEQIHFLLFSWRFFVFVSENFC